MNMNIVASKTGALPWARNDIIEILSKMAIIILAIKGF
jgi:hypothetical protein